MEGESGQTKEPTLAKKPDEEDPNYLEINEEHKSAEVR